MNICFRLFVFLVITCVVVPGPVLAQGDAGGGDEWLLLQISSYSQGQDTKVDTVLRLLRRIFVQSDVDGGGVSARDYVLAEQIEQAQALSEMLKRWGQWDLDGDGKVTRAELAQYFSRQSRQDIAGQGGVSLVPTKEQSAEMLAKLVGDALVWDLDHEGTITLAEVRQAAREAWAKRYPRTDSDFKRRQLVPLSLDANNDKTVSAAEFEAAVRRVLDDIDRNGDGKIDADEMSALRERVKVIQKAQNEQEARAKVIEKLKACGLPSPGAHTRVVMIGAYEGKGLSTVSLGGDDVEVTVSDISVENGLEPLYVVLTTYDANIWRFSGAVERIERVVASAVNGESGVPRVGVTGVARDKVTIAKLGGCIPYFSKPDSDEAKRAVEALNLAIGRSPDTMAATYGANSFSIPSGTHDDKHVMAGQMVLPRTGPAIALWRMALEYNPAGVIEIDPGAVVATLPARRYKLLPQQAGLAQLVEQGALEIFRSAKAFVISDSEVRNTQLPSHLVIRKKMRYPAGLFGGHSTTFVLPPGVPEPEGNPGHSRVIKGKEAAEMIGEGGSPNATRQQ